MGNIENQDITTSNDIPMNELMGLLATQGFGSSIFYDVFYSMAINASLKDLL
ncbi:hypothetical protein [Bdellovibrio sp.]|uniref:hypothetical protein n=1 Tax=Bdellovibrio sp. TaxID=28201 RepID=UPI0039E6CE05